MYKIKRLLSISLAFILCLSLFPTIKANASSAVDLIGDSSLADVSGVRYGVSYTQTGYLCYLLTSDGRAVSDTEAVALKCPGFNTITAGGTPVFLINLVRQTWTKTNKMVTLHREIEDNSN